MYVPVYFGIGVPDVDEVRRSRFIGVVYSPFRAHDFLSAIFTGFYSLSIPNSILVVWSFVLINRGLKSNLFCTDYFHYNVFLILLL